MAVSTQPFKYFSTNANDTFHCINWRQLNPNNVAIQCSVATLTYVCYSRIIDNFIISVSHTVQHAATWFSMQLLLFSETLCTSQIYSVQTFLTPLVSVPSMEYKLRVI